VAQVRSDPETTVPGPGSCCENAAGTTAAIPGQRWLRSARYARWLAWASLAWMAAEGVLGLIAGVAAGSIALAGWVERGTAYARSLPAKRWRSAVR
jgi:hypothetical protein